MEVSMSGLVVTSLYALALGIFLGAVFDVVRIIKSVIGVNSYYPHTSAYERVYSKGVVNIFKKKCKKTSSSIITALLDVVFFTFSAVVFVLFLYCMNYGVFRWFILCAVVVGFRLYYISIGRITIYSLERISDLIKFIVNLLIYVVLFPLKKLMSFLNRCVFFKILRLFHKLTAAIDKKRKKRYTFKCMDKLPQFFER